ncbi:Fe-S cluster assembly transcriptional regulator IscR [Halomonas huangheensis]|uniref:Transcriptional regulator n=1 Tax=Halomonas huangheensis TaxID=1178482 RepID=W1NA84_9GAMM|nr:Fe-S cluster assembly transcriptional regulator IscR [Halomonas huangheensis]ALM53661.1 transcriptional regulator [Halomonas huangheensis]ERL52434.1 hypothetical protein BJB45_10735 [Halomonas huangheensis]
MRLTTKGRYAVTAMLDMAINADDGPVCLADIARRQQISLSYLEQLFARLRRAGLVESVRGPGGGYLLIDSAENISVARVIEAVNESVDTTRCGGLADCQQGDTCLTHYLWDELSERIQQFLSGVSLGELARRQEIAEIAGRQRRRLDEDGILASAP